MKRGSVGRPVGTERTVLENITSNVYDNMVCNKLVPAIHKNLPYMNGWGIIGLHNLASSRTGKKNHTDLNEAGHRQGWDINFEVQSAESHDLNKS